MQQDDYRRDQYAPGPSSYGGPYQDNSYDNNNYQPPSAAARVGGGTSSYPQQYRDEDGASEMGEEPFDLNSIDPALRLRTTRTAHSVIAESIRGEEVRERKRLRLFTIRRRGTRRKQKEEAAAAAAAAATSADGTASDYSRPPSVAPSTTTSSLSPENAKDKVLPRRTVFVNMDLPMDQVDHKGDPQVRYARNKVRTSKYTLVTFLPRNLFEQFHRVANIYFLGLVILQLFSIFGATTPQIAMLPLVAILGMTAIKDAVEDWRRAQLDEEVNTSAATKLGNWKNVNQPTDPRNWFERLFHLGPDPTKPSRGVRKLREQEAKDGKQIVFDTRVKETEHEELHDDQPAGGPGEAFAMKDIPATDSIPGLTLPYRPRAISMSSSAGAPSITSRRSSGVVDYSRPAAGTAQWERTLWKKLEVGDLVLLRDNEQVPADILVLSTSDPDDVCFVETKNLDGETNLKVRKSMKPTAQIRSEEDLEHARFTLDSEPPHANLYAYNGVLKYRPTGEGGLEPNAERIEPCTINELLLRGCTMRNTKWVIGLVVFTGADTKIMLNGGETPSKRSKIEKETNFNVVMNFIILIGLCLCSALLHGYYVSQTGTSARSYEQGAMNNPDVYVDSLIIFVSSLIVFQNIVPISLYITVEIVKTIQAYFIFQDIEMYYGPYDTPCVPKTWNISDDLGQIEYVFSDKTGTLTQNVMEFKKCSVMGVPFGEGITEAMLGAQKREGKDVSHTMEDQAEELAEFKATMLGTMKRSFKNRYLRDDQLTLIAPDLAKRLGDKNDALRPHIIAFFRALALCHSVLSDKPEPEKQPFVLDYKAESPDEAALVAAARDVGFPFVNRNTNRVDIEVMGVPERWIPLRVLEFNSTRKRMSAILRSPEGKIILYCKGADSVIYERLAKDHDEELKKTTLKDLENFANGGLRTLCIAYRELSEDEFDSWAKQFDAAAAAVANRDEEIDKAAELIEHSLTILGATALEDKLQEGVPDAIANLHAAGIKMWILTGDKVQTAIEIGYSCNLLTNDMEVMIIAADSKDSARAQIEAGLNKMSSVLGSPAARRGSKVVHDAKPAGAPEFAVVIDGESLRYALQDDLKPLFLSLGTQCSAVICCRVSPSQKALTVKLVKDGCKAMCLSIGDGANDVAMIQEANIGVGLFGLEGSQAAMSADYAFGQFRFLTRLLLVHGRWSYVRVADMHANFFYKNVVWTFAMFWFLLFSSFDATYLFQYTFVLLYNLVFTSLPVAILGAFDQDTNAAASMAFPQLYKRGILGLDYTRTRFWLYMLDGLYQSAIVYFIPQLVYWDGTTWSASGRDTNDLYDLSTCMAVAAVFAANLYVGINSRYWTIIPAVVIPVSILVSFLWAAIYSSIGTLDYSGVVEVIFPTFHFWATALFTVFLAVGPHWVLQAFRQSYFYRDKDIIREAWIAGDLKEQLGIQRRKRRRHQHAVPDVEDNGYSGYMKRQDTDGPFAGPTQQAAPLLESKGYPEATGSPQPQSPGFATPPYQGYAPPPPALVFEPPTQDTDPTFDSPRATPLPPFGQIERPASAGSGSSNGIAHPAAALARHSPANYQTTTTTATSSDVDAFYSGSQNYGAQQYPSYSARPSPAPSDSTVLAQGSSRPPHTGYAV